MLNSSAVNNLINIDTGTGDSSHQSNLSKWDGIISGSQNNTDHLTSTYSQKMSTSANETNEKHDNFFVNYFRTN